MDHPWLFQNDMQLAAEVQPLDLNAWKHGPMEFAQNGPHISYSPTIKISSGRNLNVEKDVNDAGTIRKF
jgi:hypothetical protein